MFISRNNWAGASIFHRPLTSGILISKLLQLWWLSWNLPTPGNTLFPFDITMTSYWPRWRLKSPASRLFTQSFIQTQIKENIKAPRHWPLCGEFTGTPPKGPVTRKMFPFDDVIMILVRINHLWWPPLHAACFTRTTWKHVWRQEPLPHLFPGDSNLWARVCHSLKVHRAILLLVPL